MTKFIFHTIIVFIFSLQTTNAQSGEKKYGLEFGDVYVISIKVKANLLQRESTCVYKNGTTCNLYKIEILNVLYCPRNNVFDSIELMKLEYIIAPIKWVDVLNSDQPLLITAMPSSTNKYIALTRILKNELLNGYTFYHPHAYLSGLIKCKKMKKDFFKDYICSQK